MTPPFFCSLWSYGKYHVAGVTSHLQVVRIVEPDLHLAVILGLAESRRYPDRLSGIVRDRRLQNHRFPGQSAVRLDPDPYTDDNAPRQADRRENG